MAFTMISNNIEFIINLLKLEIGDGKSYDLYETIMKNNNVEIILSLEQLIPTLDKIKLMEVSDFLNIYINDYLVYHKYGNDHFRVKSIKSLIQKIEE